MMDSTLHLRTISELNGIIASGGFADLVARGETVSYTHLTLPTN